jgi:CPA2 family monovalent cation:H+ antiporter-2
MVFEDLVIAGLLVALGVLATTGGAPSGWGELIASLARAAGFVAVLMILAWRFHRPVGALLRARSEESFTLVLVAFVLMVAAAALASGLSEAIGAFLAGLVVGATNLKEKASRTLAPFQTVFAALFFVSFGTRVDLGNLSDVAGTAFLLVLLGFATKACGGFLAGRSVGYSHRLSFVVGMSLVPKGEFSIVLASMAAAVAHPDTQIETLTGVYVFALSILGPIAMREADRMSDLMQSLRRRKPAPETERRDPS